MKNLLNENLYTILLPAKQRGFLNLFMLLALPLILMNGLRGYAMPVRSMDKKQSITVNGLVKSVKGDPLAGVIVQVKGKKNKAFTNNKGMFSIKTDDDDTLMFSHDEYGTKEVSIGGQDYISVVLGEPASPGNDLNEYVYTYFDRKSKNEITGAYSKISGETIENNPIINNANKLQGVLPGLFVMQNNGEPGDESASLWLRGKRTFRNNDPVILVDGFERSMNLLDPNEIESVTVMKDAGATAQYGLRGGNGIIQVTTRRGSEGKIRINLNARSGMRAPTTRPRPLNSFQYATLYNEALINDEAAPKYSAADLDKYSKASQGIYENPLDPYLYPDINWYDKYTKNYTWQQRYSLGIDGGNQAAKYFISAGYTNNSGLYNVDRSVNTYNTNSNMNMISIRSNLDINVNKRFMLSLDLSGRQEQRTYPGSRTDNSLTLFRALYNTPPNAFPALTPDGLLAGTKDYTNNPNGLLNYKGYSLYHVRSLTTTLRARHELDFITPGLNMNGTVAFDSWFDQNINRTKNFKVYDLRQPDGTVQYLSNGAIRYVETGSNTQMSSSADYPSTRRIFNTDLSLDYSREFGKHAVSGLVAFAKRDIADEDNANIPRVYMGTNGRLAYAFNKRYFAGFNFAYQGSEQFLPGNKFGFFPAASIGWLASEENFLKNNQWINFLKLRASHGITGNDDLGGYFLWYQKYQGGSSSLNTGYTSLSSSGWQESAFALNNVTWEKVRKTDLGLDAAFIKNKVNLSFDYFYEKNSNIMIQPALPNIMGIRFPNFPIGVVENRGFDMSLGFTHHIGKLEFSVNGMLSKADNKILDQGEESTRYPYQKRTGHSLDAVFGLEAIGLFQNQAEIDASPKQSFGVYNPGDIRYKDQNGDGVIDAFDETYLGTNANPNIQYGGSLGLKFSGFDLNILLTGQQGGKLYLSGESIWEFHNNGTVREQNLGRFVPSDPTTWANASYPRLSLSNKANNQRTSTYWGRDARMLRLKSVEIGFTLPQRWLSSLTMKKIRIYMNGYDLHTWSSTNLVDIEARSGHYVVYPIQRIINAGLNVTF